jgi:hypothetical protein
MKRSSFLNNISAQPAKKEAHHVSRKKKIVEEVAEDIRSPMERLQDRSELNIQIRDNSNK